MGSEKVYRQITSYLEKKPALRRKVRAFMSLSLFGGAFLVALGLFYSLFLGLCMPGFLLLFFYVLASELEIT